MKINRPQVRKKKHQAKRITRGTVQETTN